ncbi:caspase family protein [Labrys okinawensis]|uniref:caspase family protein n=1 Tax=Labrys okinawensis TaxID=346911 RepID=UPI0039BD18B5
MRTAIGTLLVLMVVTMLLPPAWAQDAQAPSPQSQQEKRIALVIGNSSYAGGTLPTTANDAGLIAQTLQAAGFDVVGARDLDQDALRHAFRDFLDKAGQSGPDTVAFVYLAGYGVQLEGQNYFVPVEAKLATPAAIPSEAVRLSDLIQPLAGLHLRADMVVIDAARANKFAQGDQPLAGGLALMDANPNSLVAFNAAPGTVAPQEQGPYGAYAQALAETIRVGGLPVADVFDRVRLRVNEQTQGGMLPWSVSRISEPFVFFDRGQGAPPPQATYYGDKSLQSKHIADFDARDAYAAAVARDTLPAYQDFITAYPRDPMAKRVRAIIAARREAITWRETWTRDTPNAYWSYLRRYRRGPHAWDARRRLDYLSAALEPPPTFDVIDYDVPPPEEDEIVYVDRPVFIFSDPDFDLPPPPPPPIIFLPPPPREFIVLAPPPPPPDPYLLPTPPFVAVPDWVRPPRYVEPPPQNFIFNNIHDARVINERINEAPRQEGLTPGEKAGAALAIGAGAAAVALPLFLRNRANRPPAQGQPGVGGAPVLPGVAPQPGRLPPAQTLPGMNGQPLPLNKGRQPLPQPGVIPGQQPGGKIQPGLQPSNQNQPGTFLPGQQNQPNQLNQPGAGVAPGVAGQPGQKGNLRFRKQRGNAPLQGGQVQPNVQTGQPVPGVGQPVPGVGQPVPGITPGKPQAGRRRLPGQQPGAPGGAGSGQPLPATPVQPGGRQPPVPGQPALEPGVTPQGGQQPLPRAKRFNQAAPPQGGQPQTNNPPQRFNPQSGQRPRMQFQPPGGEQTPRQQLRPQPQFQPRPQPQMQVRPQPQQQPRPQPQFQPRPQPQFQPRPQPQFQPRPQPQMQVRPQPQQQMRPQPQVRPQPQPQPRAPAAPAGRPCGRPGLPPCQ